MEVRKQMEKLSEKELKALFEQDLILWFKALAKKAHSEAIKRGIAAKRRANEQVK